MSNFNGVEAAEIFNQTTTDCQHRRRQIDIVKRKVEGFAQTQARNAQQPEQAIVDPGQPGTALVAMRHVARGIE